MKISICLPYMKRSLSRNTLKQWCELADASCLHSLSCGERITDYTFEMRNVLAFAAALTERIRIVPSLYVLPMHSAVWAAKEIATLDQLSEGRVTLTVGVGGRENDYRAVEASFKNRHQRMDEQISEMRRIWAGEAPFEGADPVGPKPYQNGGPPILAGAMGPKAIARASHWADGLYSFSMNGDKQETERMFNTGKQCWQQSEGETAPYLAGGFWFSLTDNAEQELKNYVYNYLKVLGNDMATAVADSMTRFNGDNILHALDDMEACGADEVFLASASDDICELERLLRLIEKR